MCLTIHRGTASHGEPSLCYTCRFATCDMRLRAGHHHCDMISSSAQRLAGRVAFARGPTARRDWRQTMEPGA